MSSVKGPRSLMMAILKLSSLAFGRITSYCSKLRLASPPASDSSSLKSESGSMSLTAEATTFHGK